MAQTRWNISLPVELKDRVHAEANEKNDSPSALIAQYITEHYNGALRNCEERLKEASAQDGVIRDLQAKLEAAETQTNELGVENVNKAGQIRLLEQKLAAAQETQQQLEHGTRELIKQAEQERASKETVRTGLQHRVELAENNAKHLSDQVADLKGQIHDLQEDKAQLQKQIMVMLPAPKQSWWSRVFRRKKQEHKQEVG